MKPWPRVLLSLLLLAVFGGLIAFNLLGDRLRWSGGSGAPGVSRQPAGSTRGVLSPSLPDRPTSSSAEEEPGWPGALLTGEVRASGRPVQEAEVEWILIGSLPGAAASAARARTRADGRFRLVVPPAQSGALRVTHPGSPPLLRHGLLAPSAEEGLDLGRMELPQACFLRVLVLDRKEGLPVDRAALTLVRPKGLARPEDLAPKAMTGPEGAARLGPAAPGPWHMEVRGPGFSPLRVQVDLAADQAPGETTVFLPRGPGLQGRVVDPNGLGLGGVQVAAVPRIEGDGDERAATTASTAAGGSFHLEGLVAGLWLLEARGAGHASPQTFAVTCPSEKPLEVHVVALPLLHGSVQTPTGPAPQGTRVLLARSLGQGASWLVPLSVPPAETDASGRFRLLLDRPPGPGSWELVALASGWLPAAGPSFELIPGRPPEAQVLVLEPGLEIRGRLVPGTRGKATLGWGGKSSGIPSFLPAQPALETWAGPEGEFLLTPVRPGLHLVRLVAPGRVPRQIPVDLSAGKSVDLGPVLLSSGWRPRGLLLGLDGSPEPGGLVWMIPLPHGEPIQAVAGEDGRFQFPPLPEGSYTLKACRRDIGDLERLGDYGATARTIDIGGRNPENLGTIQIAPPGMAGSEQSR